MDSTCPTLTEDLDPHLASRGERLSARLLDSLVFWGPHMLALLAARFDAGPTVVYSLVAAGFLSFPVQMVLLLSRSQSIGKLIVGISIVDKQGQRAGWGRGLAREGVRWWAWLFFPPFAFAAEFVDGLLVLNEDHRAIHDRVAGTYVVCSPYGRRTVSPGAGVGSPRLSAVRDLPLPVFGGARLGLIGLSGLLGMALSLVLFIFAPVLLAAVARTVIS